MKYEMKPLFKERMQKLLPDSSDFEKFEKIEEEVVGHGVHEQFHELLKQLKSKYLDQTL